MSALASLTRFLGSHPAVAGRCEGDTCTAIANPGGTGHLLFAAQGMPEWLVAADPWFAGYLAVMANLSEIAAMGGRPVAVTDVLWTPAESISMAVWEGMQAAAQAYQIPILGGHATPHPAGRAMPGAAALGHAGDRLITRFDIRSDDRLVIAIDMHGSYRGDHLFWNSSEPDLSSRLRSDLELLPSLAEKGLCHAGKDIGNGGIAGTLAMLCHCSEVGVELELGDLPCPMDVEMERWLVTTPGYGYLLAVAPEDIGSVVSHFTATRITCREIGRFTAGHGITLRADGESADVVFGQPGIDAAGDVLHAGEAAV